VIAATAAAAAFAAAPAVTAATSQAGTSAKGWRIVKTIKVNNVHLNDLVTLPGGLVWVSGSSGSPFSHPLFYHLSNGKWVKISRPGVSGNSIFAEDISASSDSNVWSALGNGAAFDHWNGHVWNRVSFGTTANAAADSVLAVGPNRAWAFTTDFSVSPIQETAHFFNGSTWTSTPLPGVPDSDAGDQISASSASNAWTWAIDPVQHTWEALHFNGKQWAVVPIPARLIPHHGTTTGGGGRMLAESSTNVWASVVSENLSGPTVLLHWNGTAWHRAKGQPPAGELLGPMASDGRGGVWLYAARHMTKAPFEKPFFVDFRHGTWTRAAAPTSPAGLVQVSAIALIPGSTSLLGAGTIESSQTNVAGVIIKFGL
jgi:hypothetical protein